ncbi:hypothetical protein C8R43DRAFT_1142039 [Mycena crocata]|nr:hypothetical protein C8R43DRAFT_1142039 [Mycena crocata]
MQFFKSVSFIVITLATAASANPVPLANSANTNRVLHPYGGHAKAQDVSFWYPVCLPPLSFMDPLWTYTSGE